MTKTTLKCGVLAAVMIVAGCGSDGGSGGAGGSGGGGKSGGTGGAGHTGGTTGTGGVPATGGSTGTGGSAGGGGVVGTGGTAGGGGIVGTGGAAGGAGHGGGGGHPAGGGAAGAGGAGGAGGAAGTAGAAGSGGAGGAGGAGCVLTGGIGGTAWLMAPIVPQAIAVPSGATVKVHDRGIGAQIYTCMASGGGGGGAGAVTYSWVATPSANLYDSGCNQVGTHQAGPSWTSGGGTITGMKLQQADAPTAGNIPWLLLKVSIDTTTGPFTDVTYVQRVNTAGGVAPSSTCNAGAANTEVSVPYTADYYFFTGGSGAGGAGGAGN
jgi:hypothetical protein